MTMQYVSVQLDVVTASSSASYETRFSSGLNVIEAPNSWGKSTLVQSLVYGLGLEGSFSTSQLSPLGEAMTSSIDLDGHRQAVVESSVTLVLRNDRNEYLRTKRWARSLDHQLHLIQTWSASSEAELEVAIQEDRYVRESGAAVREMGFHTQLAQFIGWSLPQVPSFNGSESPLYLEVLFPMFYVEQKYGWSGLAPRIPTNFQIQSAYRRAAEFVLGLESLERTKQIERQRQSLARLQSLVQSYESSLTSELSKNDWRISSPIKARRRDEDLLEGPGRELFEVETGDGWVPVEVHIELERRRLAQLQTLSIVPAGQRTPTAQRELHAAERQVAQLGARVRQLQELLEATQSEHSVLTDRLTELNADRNRLLDIAKLERLGSDLELSSVSAAHCPTCAQSLDSAHVATGLVLDLAANTKLVLSERNTVESLLTSATSRVTAIEARIGVESGRLREGRLQIRALRDELVGPANAPSVAQVRAILVLENDVAAMESGLASAEGIAENLAQALGDMAVVESNLRALRREGPDTEDSRTIRFFGQEFRKSLENFGFSSLPVDELSISDSTLLPEHDGFELTFDINHGLSASDTIRAKWAFYAALSRVCVSRPLTHHLGTLIMDEPRQQEAALGSVSALYRELAEIGHDNQVIVASSAARVDLESSLAGLAVNRIVTEKDHVLAV